MAAEPFSDVETAPSDADTENEPTAGNRSRSQSRRARRRKQQLNKPKASAKAQAPPMPPVEEAPSAETQAEIEGARAMGREPLKPGQTSKDKPAEVTMQPFEWIGPDSTSMNGPVTYARAMRGEIPFRPGNPNQSLGTGYKPEGAGKDEGDKAMEQDGLKLRLDLNIDIEIELKARIHGDLTLSLFA